MSTSAIVARGLAKRYRIGSRPTLQTLRDRLMRAAAPNADAGWIWALDGLDFTVAPGEVVGVIGRNGAGKSTLLKILSRITEPTRGEVTVRGRVGSLLEVGTGFHHELTGRENIFLNGAILGMRRREISARFDEIVAFAEVERFLDTPVKHYSSGMYGRLAFAVAAHLDPDILLVDEVLSVGDAEFQKKCIGRMAGVASTGRTVLFVSHNLAAVEALCSRGLLIERGRLIDDGPVGRVLDTYARLVRSAEVRATLFPAVNREYGVAITNADPRVVPENGDWSLLVDLSWESSERRTNIGLGFGLRAATGVTAAWIPPQTSHLTVPVIHGKASGRLIIRNISSHLAGGEYLLSIWLRYGSFEDIIRVEDFAVVDIPASDVYGTGQPVEHHRHGIAPLRAEYTPLS